ncbi:hypothetical protein [Duganella sp. sic0402]|uniref:hypothetical protein n=1 Tax=Duganella sp. sic0402 TaxID=2854786 RepID=UPI0035A2EA6C
MATGLWIAAPKLGPLMVPSVGLILIAIWGWREIFYVTNSPSESRYCSTAELRYIQGEGGDEQGKQTSDTSRMRKMPWLDAINRTRQVVWPETVRQVANSWNILGVAIGYGCMIGISNIFMSWIRTTW